MSGREKKRNIQKFIPTSEAGVLSVLIEDNMDEVRRVSHAPKSTVISMISQPEAGVVLINCKPLDVAIEAALTAMWASETSNHSLVSRTLST